jgi:primase-polymerase (primpol)-like protein
MTDLEHNAIPEKPEPLPPVFSNIPAVLKTARIWVVWDYVLIDGRWAKVPFSARRSDLSVEHAARHIGRVGWWPRAKTNHTATWATWEDALDVADRFAGVGLMVCKGVCGVDLDKCVDRDGAVADWAGRIVADLDGYTELSPSGGGLRVLTLAVKPGERCRSGPVEMYVNTRFLTLTGHVIRRRGLDRRDRQIAALYARLFASEAPLDPVEAAAASIRRAAPRSLSDHRKPADAGDREARFRALWAGDMSSYDLDHSRADLALCNMLAPPCAYEHDQVNTMFRRSGLMRPKWDRDDYRERTLTLACGPRDPLTDEERRLYTQLYGKD